MSEAVEKIYAGGTVSRSRRPHEVAMSGQLRPDYCTVSGPGVGFEVAKAMGLNHFDYDSASQSYIPKMPGVNES